jgi:7-keto-8-aminopelargonate synthetase-like enzyme
MDVVNFAGNDYLGLAREPRLADALASAARERGISNTSSRWGLGWTDLHQSLEDELTDFLGTEDTCLMGATYLGGPAYYECMAGEFKTVVCDATVHSNQFLGMRGAGLEVVTFKHLDAADCRARLDQIGGEPPIVATDGVYGISGEVAPIEEICDAANSVGGELFIDDAHGMFALGAEGRGAPQACGLEPGDATVLASMGKALGCSGGFITGRKELVERFRRSAPASGSAIPPPAITAACREALRIVRAEPERRERMWAAAERMRRALAGKGISVVTDRSPIVAMVFADEFEAAAACEHFLKLGLRIPYFKYASEPRHNLLRAAARACYTEEHLERFEEAVEALERQSR